MCSIAGAEATPVPLAGLRDSIASARADFQAARYDRLPAILPRLIATARATSDSAASSEQADASTLLAGAFILAADFAVKLNDDPLAWMTADRALQAAQAGNDPLTLADARRAVATAMRRTGHPDRACSLLVRACRDIDVGRHGADELAMYGTLLNVAAYTAATAGNRRAAAEYIDEAAAAATRLGPRASRRQPAFGPAGVTLYQVSIAQVLGDNGTAIEHARNAARQHPDRRTAGPLLGRCRPRLPPVGKARSLLPALLAAERAAPAEVRYRPPVHRMTEDLLRTGPQRSLPGLRAFAAKDRPARNMRPRRPGRSVPARRLAYVGHATRLQPTHIPRQPRRRRKTGLTRRHSGTACVDTARRRVPCLYDTTELAAQNNQTGERAKHNEARPHNGRGKRPARPRLPRGNDPRHAEWAPSHPRHPTGPARDQLTSASPGQQTAAMPPC